MTQVNFTSSDTWVVPAGVTQLDHLLKVAGGGSGGKNTRGGGGGGAGGVVHSTSVTVVPGETLTITIGAGGTAPGVDGHGNAGSDTTVTGSTSGALGSTALGGGRGGGQRNQAGGNGACGGGGCGGQSGDVQNGGTGSQGGNGGNGTSNSIATSRAGGGGGGMAPANGNNANGGITGGNGGAGIDKSATFGTVGGAAGVFGGGGGGGRTNGAGGSIGVAGAGGGGNGGDIGLGAGGNGTANTGGGGGGSGTGSSGTVSGAAGNGGSGFVALIYTPVSPPGVPTSVTATPTTTEIDLDWAAPASGGTPTGYEVRIDGGTPEDVGNVLTHLFDLLTPDTGYTVGVRAYNAGGSSSWVDVEVSTLAVPPPPTPGVQQFDTVDVLRLEVEGEPEAGHLNLLMNPDGRYGGAGWLTPASGSIHSEGGSGELEFTADADAVAWDDVPIFTESVAVTPLEFYSFQITIVSLDAVPSTKGLVALIEFLGFPTTYAGELEVVDASTWFGSAGTPETDPDTYEIGPTPAPFNAIMARITLYYEGAEIGDQVVFNDAAIVGTGGESDPIDWADVVDEGEWVNVLGHTHELSIVRPALDLGTLSATIIADSLDPATDDLLRLGRRCRLVNAADDEPYFTGKIATANVTYQLKYAINHPGTTKTARITLTAVDGMTRLATEERPDGVADVNDLRAILEGCGIPWNIDGSTNQIPPPTPANRIDGAKAADQISITRDTHHGYAWIDRAGVFRAASVLPLGEDPEVPVTLDETAYSDLVVTYDPAWLINHVTVVVLDLDGGGDPVETRYGPFVNAASYARYGERSATFTINQDGLTSAAVTVPEFAAAIFTTTEATATVESVTIPIVKVEDLTTAKALLDVYTLVEVLNADRSLAVESRITSVSHRITGRKWLMTLELAPVAAVPWPQRVPSNGNGTA